MAQSRHACGADARGVLLRPSLLSWRARATRACARALVAVAGLLAAPLQAGPADGVAPVRIVGDATLACAVWQRELGFAASVAAHDRTAFAEHVDPDAVFGPDTPSPHRGRAAVLAAWAGLIEGRTTRLRWYPDRVVVTGRLAWSTGPALFEPVGAAGEPRLTRFRSVWRRGSDDVWRVLFDDGDPPRPVSAEAVTAFERGRQAACP